MKHTDIDVTPCPLGGAVISDRVVARLLDELRTGRFQMLDRLPSELELASMLGVSRTVIRDALSEMQRDGYIERVRGIGTVVNRDVLNIRTRLDQKLEYFPLIRSLGGSPRVDCLDVQCGRPEPDVAASLGLGEEDEVLCIRKRVLSDSAPVIYSVDHLPRALFGEADLDGIDLAASVFDVLEQYCGQQVCSNVAHLKASCGDEAIRGTMQLAPGDALLLLDEVCYNRLCQPVMRSFSYYTPFFDFAILRKLV